MHKISEEIDPVRSYDLYLNYLPRVSAVNCYTFDLVFILACSFYGPNLENVFGVCVCGGGGCGRVALRLACVFVCS